MGKTKIGAGAHTDYGLLTILKQDMIGGLQVYNALQDAWVHAYPVPNSFVINFGDMLAAWSSHRVKSTIHRVVHSQPCDRYSVPYFLEPNADSWVAPIDKPDEGVTSLEMLMSYYVSAGMLPATHTGRR